MEYSKYIDLKNPAENVMQLMRSIVEDMKEIPQLPSEVPSDQQTLLAVGYPVEGGMLTYMSGHDHPYRGFPFFEIVEKIDLIKKVTRGSLSGLYHSLKRTHKLWLITLIPSLWAVKNLIEAGVYTFYRLVERNKAKPERCSQSVREVHRAFSRVSNQFRDQLRDLVCMVLEFDNAYRYRFQDVIPELDKGALKKHPRKELNRLWDILISREKTQEIKDTWRLGKMGSIYLWFDRSLLRLIVDVLMNLDLNEIQLSIEDKEYCVPRKDYSFKFVTEPTPEDLKITVPAKINFDRSERLKALREEAFAEQKELDTRHKLEQEQKIRMRSAEEGKVVSQRVRDEFARLDMEFGLKKQTLLQAHLTDEERAVLEHQRAEMQQSVDKYDVILKQVDEEFAQEKINYLKTCQ